LVTLKFPHLAGLQHYDRNAVILQQLIFAILEICLLSCNWNFVNEIYLTADRSVCLARVFRTV